MSPRLSKYDALEVIRAAERMEIEAETWRDGFAKWIDGMLIWDHASTFAQVRYVGLLASARRLRSIAARAYREPEYFL